jgi:U3 small nucleolar RNA-associated protein 15
MSGKRGRANRKSTGENQRTLGRYNKVPLVNVPTYADKKPKSAYWNNFSLKSVHQLYGPVTSINFCPSSPHLYAVTCSSVQIFDPDSNNPTSNITRFKETPYCASFRQDGKLLVAGGEEGIVKLFDMTTRGILRKFEEHTDVVRVTKFSPDNVTIMSASDDTTVRSWDIVTGENVVVLNGHEDHVRCGSAFSAHSWATGSYDHTIRCWDTRSREQTFLFDHGNPVEDILVFPGGGVIVSAGGNQIKIWDVFTGNMLKTLNLHQKTVTKLDINFEESFLFTASLDQHIRVVNTQTYEVEHNMKCPSPILSMAISPDLSHIVTGMTDGKLSIKYRRIQISSTMSMKKTKKNYSNNNWKYHLKGKNYKSVVDNEQDKNGEVSGKPQSLKKFDKLMRKFHYREAIDSEIQKKNPIIVVSLFQELIRRKSLHVGLAGRNEQGLIELLNFLNENILNVTYRDTLVEVTNTTLDIYSPVLGFSPQIDNLIISLRKLILQELNFQKEILQMIGTLELLFSINSDNFIYNEEQ